MNILGICGSLQGRSSNRALLEAARDIAGAGPAGRGMIVDEYRGIERLPHFNPDIDRDGEGPPAVVELRSLVRAADGVLIASPEYAFGVPGALKNMLDWLVGSGDLYEKPAALLSAAPSAERGANARADLERTLRGQGARVVASSTIVVPRRDAFDVRSDATARAQLESVLQALRVAVEQHATR